MLRFYSRRQRKSRAPSVTALMRSAATDRMKRWNRSRRVRNRHPLFGKRREQSKKGQEQTAGAGKDYLSFVIFHFSFSLCLGVLCDCEIKLGTRLSITKELQRTRRHRENGK